MLTLEKLFCYDCAKRQAESVAGLGNYELYCMSMEGCHEPFPDDQRALFLDRKLTKLLLRLEQRANLLQAGVENIVSCPFCDFVAECLPVEEDKEFRCQNPDCLAITCRLCSRETHIPKGCNEVVSEDEGMAARRRVEEAMSAALIRRCVKCEYHRMRTGNQC